MATLFKKQTKKERKQFLSKITFIFGEFFFLTQTAAVKHIKFWHYFFTRQHTFTTKSKKVYIYIYKSNKNTRSDFWGKWNWNEILVDSYYKKRKEKMKSTKILQHFFYVTCKLSTRVGV